MTRRGLLGGSAAASVLGAGAFAIAVAAAPRHAMYVYLAAVSTTISVALGGVLLVMIAHLAGARWFVTLRNLAAAIGSALPAAALLFVPIVLAVREIYPWAAPRGGTLDERVERQIEHLRPWMNTPLFAARAALYFVVWVAFAELLRRASTAEEHGGGTQRRQKRLSSAGVPLIGLTGSFAAFDWVMSALPGFSSNILGLYLLVGGFAAAVGLLAIGFHGAREAGLLPPQVGDTHAHAIGRMLLMSVCLWAYLAASQLIIVWSADLPSEAAFYLARWDGPWRSLAMTLVVGHFVVPFLLLLHRGLKRRPAIVAMLGAWVVVMHAVDVYWLVVPAAGAAPGILDIAVFVGVAGACAALGAIRFAHAAPVPVADSDLSRSIAYESP
jgi:hypothetical protein